jgi:hypothetical protein
MTLPIARLILGLLIGSDTTEPLVRGVVWALLSGAAALAAIVFSASRYRTRRWLAALLVVLVVPAAAVAGFFFGVFVAR